MRKKVSKKFSRGGKKTSKKKTKRTPAPLTENEFGTLLESIDSKLGLVVEAHTALDKKIDKKTDRLDAGQKDLNFQIRLLQRSGYDLKKYIDTVDKTTRKIHCGSGFIVLDIA